MTPEQWSDVRANTDAIRAERDALRVLLNAARMALPEDSPLHPAICEALGLVSNPQRKAA